MSERAEASGAAFWGDADETEALHRYQRLVNAVDEGIYQLDTDGRFVAANDVVVELTGYARAELLGEHVSEVVDASSAEREIELLYEPTGGRSERFELSLRTAEGELVPCEVRTNPIVEDDVVRGTVGTVREITDPDPGGREQRRRLERYERILETIEDGVYVLDGDSRFLLANETFASMLGVDRDSLYGKHVSFAFGEEAASTGDELQREMIEGETDIAELEETLVTADGEVPVTTRFTLFEMDGEFGRVGVVRDVTERKERERELRERERHLERYKEYTDDILDAIDDVFYVIDRNGELKRWNESLAEVTGYTNEEIDEMHATDFFEDDQRETASNAVREGFETGSVNVELELQRKEGNDVPFEFAASKLEDPSGTPVLAGIGRDVTERVERQRALEESERRYRTLVENFPNGAVGLVDEDLRYTVAGGEMFRAADITSDELVGQTVRERYPEPLADTFDANLRAAFEGETNTFEVGFHDRHWQAHTLPVRDEEEDIFAGMVMVQDITTQIEREQELQASKNQLQALIELLPVAVFVAEDDGQIVEWNEAAKEVWGGQIAESESVAEYDEYDGWWADTGDPVEPDEWPLARALRGEEVTDPDVIEIEGFDGERRTVLNHGIPVRDADGEVSRAVVTLIDITERREYQRRLEESNERLEEFAYAASHDLQEPLRMVSSYLRLIEERYADELDEDGREFIDFAVDGADRMRDMIDGLLEYSRVDTRGDPFETVDLNDVLADVREDLQMTIEESGAEITADFLPRVVGDPGQLRQVFQNLLDNAIEYSGGEPPEIHVSAGTDTNASNAASEAAQNGEKRVISVSDRGVGIDPADAERVFDVFQRLHAPDEHPGTGIGLALCDRIIERHGGDIWVESEPGEGATFSFTLPAAGDDGD